MVQFTNVDASPSERTAPPPLRLAELPLMIQLAKRADELRHHTPPPCELVKFPEIVQPKTSGEDAKQYSPPPFPKAELHAIVQFAI